MISYDLPVIKYSKRNSRYAALLSDHFSFDKDVYWLLRLKLEKAILLVVSGVVLMVVIERWIEQVLPALLDKM